MCSHCFTACCRCNGHASLPRTGPGIADSQAGSQRTVHWRNAGRGRSRRFELAAAAVLLAFVAAAAASVDGDRRALAAASDDGQWVRAAGDYASTRYSRLAQITSANVKQLRVAWSFATGVRRGHEAAPLVVGDTMYVVTPYPNVLYALDLRAGNGAVRWKYEPKPAAA